VRAVRFGLPSAVRGVPGVGKFNHCALAAMARNANRMPSRRIISSPPGPQAYLGGRKRSKELAKSLRSGLERLDVDGQAAHACLDKLRVGFSVVEHITPSRHVGSSVRCDRYFAINCLSYAGRRKCS